MGVEIASRRMICLPEDFQLVFTIIMTTARAHFIDYRSVSQNTTAQFHKILPLSFADYRLFYSRPTQYVTHDRVHYLYSNFVQTQHYLFMM